MRALHPALARSFEILRFQNAIAGRPRGDMEETYRRVIDVLTDLGVRWALVGAHAVNTYVRPRATEDIDLVVDAKRMKSVSKALENAFGPLELDDIGAAIRVLNLSVDLIRSDNHVLFRRALDEAADRSGVRVPPPELLIALKFLASVSSWRAAADRGQDVVDLVRIYQALGEDLDRDRALSHASTIYPGAERELESMLDRVDRGEKIPI